MQGYKSPMFLEPAQNQMNAMLRLHGENELRSMRIRRRELERITLQNEGKYHFSLDHPEILADAYPRPPTKGEEEARALHRLRHSIAKSLRIELHHIVSPILTTVL